LGIGTHRSCGTVRSIERRPLDIPSDDHGRGVLQALRVRAHRALECAPFHRTNARICGPLPSKLGVHEQANLIRGEP
jgi:hypothetical protein